MIDVAAQLQYLFPHIRDVCNLMVNLAEWFFFRGASKNVEMAYALTDVPTFFLHSQDWCRFRVFVFYTV